MYHFASVAFVLIVLKIENSLCFNPLSLLSGASTKSTCPNVTPVENIDVSALSNGIWYEIARYPNSFEILSRCTTIKYGHYDDKINVTLLNVPFRSIYSIDGDAEYADEKRNGNFNFNFKHGWPLLRLDVPAQVLVMDYDRYAIWYSCFNDKITGLRKVESKWKGLALAQPCYPDCWVADVIKKANLSTK